MGASKHSRRRRRAPEPEFPLRLLAILRPLIDVALGRHRRGKPRHQGHGSSPHRSPTRQVQLRNLIVSKEVSVARLAIAAGLLVASIAIAWSIIAQTAAYNLAESDPAAALRWVADQPTALDGLVEQALTSNPQGDLDEAKARAQKALRADPLDAHALSLLGLIAEKKGDRQGAETLMQLAGARTWRDRTTQAWLFNQNARSGDYGKAIPHADAMLRVDHSMQTPLFPVLAALTVDPRAFKALTDFLATAPEWRGWYLTQLSGRLANQSRLIELYTALTATQNPPATNELSPYLDRLIRDGRYDLARQTWLGTLPAALPANEARPFNGDFDLPIDGLPFNWRVTTIAGAEIDIVPSLANGQRPALRVQFSGRRVPFANVAQLLLLPPGGYTLGGKVKAEELDTVRGLWWRVFCADDAKNTLAHTELVSGSLPWTDFAVDFQVPDKNCRAQWLQLELPARIPSETRIEGQIWYQSLRISQKTASGISPTATRASQ